MGMFGKGTYGMLNAVQPVYAGGRIVNGNRLAALGVEAGGYKERLVRNEVLLSTEEQYWRVVALDQKLKTAARYEDFLNRLLVKVESAYQAGLVTKNDVLKVKLKLSELMVNKSKLAERPGDLGHGPMPVYRHPLRSAVELEEAPVATMAPLIPSRSTIRRPAGAAGVQVVRGGRPVGETAEPTEARRVPSPGRDGRRRHLHEERTTPRGQPTD